MCLIALAWRATPAFPLLFAANRDERHDRPARAASWWPDLPHVFGGRDLAANGSWLGADRDGRIAAVTNFRESAGRPAPRSRGALVADFLAQRHPAEAFAASAARSGGDYGPFNLLLLDAAGLFYASNRSPPTQLGPGVHVLSNAALVNDWPKTRTARAGIESAVRERAPSEALLALLAHRSDEAGIEGYRATHFVEGPVYGTRASTVITIDAEHSLTFIERSFDAAGRPTGEVRETFGLPRSAAIAGSAAGARA